jgi:cellulose synthase/poly-beta-1,6-N-acetylglucosamine synthase-like glycosyltransferase
MNTPKISILIALRNEEENIPRLLKSIDNLSYPKNCMEILLGNDASEDNTSALLHEFAKTRPHIHVFDLTKPAENERLKGKTRVLEKLGSKASGDFFFFTDADIEVPEKWIEGMLKHFDTPAIGAVIGITGMKPESLKAAMQGMEWLTVLYFLHLFSKIGIKGTGMGNNMAVRKEAYHSTGGYANIPFSIVEDYALYKAIMDNEYHYRQAFEKDVLAWTLPPDRFFEQRKRWLTGGFQSKSSLIIPGLIQTLWIPLLAMFYFLAPQAFPWIVVFPLLLLLLTTAIWQKKLRISGYLRYVPVFCVYLPLAWFLIQIYYFLPGGVTWKNRQYE